MAKMPIKMHFVFTPKNVRHQNVTYSRSHTISHGRMVEMIL